MMHTLWRFGTYMWTASSAGWLVLFAWSEEPGAFVVSAGCAVASLVWTFLMKPVD